MPTYGPWLTPPASTVSTSYTGTTAGPWGSYGSYVTAGVDGTTYADRCESATTGTVGSNTFALARADVPNIDQMAVFFQLNAAIATFADYTPTLPPGASGIDYEGLGASEAWLTGIDAAIPVDMANTSPTAAVIQAREAIPPFDPITAGVTFVPGATLAGRTLDGTLALPAGTAHSGPFTLNATVAAGAVTNGSPGVRFAVTVLHFDGQISHVGPTDGSSWLMLLNTTATLTAAVHYQPRRYRFVYPVIPALRQYPRDDFLAGAPRQGKTHGPTSIQGSARQGWRGTYR